MKKRLFAILLLAALFITSSLGIVCADSMYSEKYYRAVDTGERLSDTAQKDLDAECISFMEEHHQDMVLLAVDPREYPEYSLEELAEGYYTSSEFGYGPGHDGFLWLYDTYNEKTELFAYGSAEGLLTQDQIDYITSSGMKNDGVYARLYSGLKAVDVCLDELESSGGQSGSVQPAPASGLPSWYPSDINSFKFYHDPDAPRVVDNADIFTDAEERAMARRIGEIGREIGKDIVIYTDVTDYGLGHDICAADFYDFNGYGYGDDYEGVCLFIDMDPDNRGWWCCCTGPETRGLYTEDIANDIDDVLFEYMVDGDYGEGVSNWIENIRTLYVKGMPFAPEWYPAVGETLTVHHDAASPRIVDDAGLLTAEEISKLSEKAAAVSQKYGVDVAIHTQPSPYGMDYTDVARKFYTYMGYGYGDDNDGIMLTVYKRPGYTATVRITSVGSVRDKLNDTEAERMRGFAIEKTDKSDYYGAMSQWLDQVDHLEKTGRVRRSGFYWGFIGVISLIIGAIFGAARLAAASIKMNAPRTKQDARSYIVPSESSIIDAGRTFLYNSTSRIYDPPRKSSSSGGSSGSSSRSSYRSSYSGSSGRSHSGSGRRF